MRALGEATADIAAKLGVINKKGNQHRDRRDDHHQGRRSDQPAVAQRRDRGGEGGRGGSRLRGRGARSSPPGGARRPWRRWTSRRSWARCSRPVASGVMEMDRFNESVRSSVAGAHEIEQRVESSIWARWARCRRVSRAWMKACRPRRWARSKSTMPWPSWRRSRSARRSPLASSSPRPVGCGRPWAWWRPRSPLPDRLTRDADRAVRPPVLARSGSGHAMCAKSCPSAGRGPCRERRCSSWGSSCSAAPACR